jgi:hypothetical protein
VRNVRMAVSETYHQTDLLREVAVA